MHYSDEIYMARCLELARKGEYYVAPNPMVGAVLVAEDGQILAEGWHRQFGGSHAEVHCFADLDARCGGATVDLRQATLYVSLEPCSHYGKTPPCAKLVIARGVGKVVVGMRDPNPLVAGKGIRMLEEAGIEVKVGVLETECRELNKRFLCLHEKKRPYVVLKWAQTADGYMDSPRKGLEDGAAMVISKPLTKQLVHKMRAENMAILVGSGTVLKDDPRLGNTRWVGRNPIRVVLDRRGRIPATARVLQGEQETIVLRCQDWQEVLRELAERGIHSVLVEGGAQVLKSILDSGIWDEAHVEVAPIRLGAVDAPRAPYWEQLLARGEKVMEVEGNSLWEVKNAEDMSYEL